MTDFITCEPSFVWNGNRYPTKIAAAEALLKFVGGQIIREHSARPEVGIITFAEEIMEVLPILVPTLGATPVEVTSEKGGREPMEPKPLRRTKGAASHVQFVRDEWAKEHPAEVKEWVLNLVADSGHRDLGQFLNCAPAVLIRKAAAVLRSNTTPDIADRHRAIQRAIVDNDYLMRNVRKWLKKFNYENISHVVGDKHLIELEVLARVREDNEE